MWKNSVLSNRGPKVLEVLVRPLGLAHNSETEACPFRLYEYAPRDGPQWHKPQVPEGAVDRNVSDTEGLRCRPTRSVGKWHSEDMDNVPLPEVLYSCSRCGVTIPGKAENDDKYELCYKCDLELSELAGGWASWNRNSPVT